MLTPQLVAAAGVRPAPVPAPAPVGANPSLPGMGVGELAGTAPQPTPRATLESAVLESLPRDPRMDPPTPRTSAPAPASTDAIVNEILKQPSVKAPPAAAALAPAPRAPTFAPRAEPAARVPAEVSAGYAALRAGDMASARLSYQAALTRDARSLDGNLGMATIEARSGNRAAAASHYRKVLDIDPHNATALAGLAGMADYARVEGLETRLLEDIARQPRSAGLHFALGNVFASQSRWHDAQAAYYEAHRLDPAAADVAYNLAVSLDHLNQPRLAAEHYRRALEASAGQATQFDPGQVRRRLAELPAPGRP
jgi:tetratricopeptide (TPR) repeat protein